MANGGDHDTLTPDNMLVDILTAVKNQPLDRKAFWLKVTKLLRNIIRPMPSFCLHIMLYFTHVLLINQSRYEEEIYRRAYTTVAVPARAPLRHEHE